MAQVQQAGVGALNGADQVGAAAAGRAQVEPGLDAGGAEEWGHAEEERTRMGVQEWARMGVGQEWGSGLGAPGKPGRLESSSGA